MKNIDLYSSGVMWRKSTFSNPSGNCLEVAEKDGSIVIQGLVHVRDSKHPKGGMLQFTKNEWTAFIDGVRQGEFNLQ